MSSISLSALCMGYWVQLIIQPNPEATTPAILYFNSKHTSHNCEHHHIKFKITLNNHF